MNFKKILFGDEARKEIKIGIDSVANATKVTLGPSGGNVCFDRGFGGPTITNDGVTIAREIILEDPIQNMGGNIIKEVAQKTNDNAGDGTTTSIILTQAIISEGMKKLSVGVNAISIKNGLEKSSKIAIEYLKSIAKPISGLEETTQVASISAESEELGKMISDTIYKLGVDSVVTVEESPIIGVTSEISIGMEFDKGYISPYMITNPERMEAEYRDVPILVTDMKLGSIKDFLPILEKVMATGKKEIVVIAEDIVGDILSTFVINKMRGNLDVLAIKAPGFGNRKNDYLRDISVITGATLISTETGMSLDKVEITDLGKAARVVSNKDKTIIVGGEGTKQDIANRIAMAKKELENIESKHDRSKIEERIAKLSGGVAIIKVGAATETETKYLKLKIEDAINATKAALEEGIVAGGGVSLLKAAIAVLEAKNGVYTSDELIGFDILSIALMAPLKNIAINAGQGDGSIVVAKVKDMTGNGGYDALKNVYVEDMLISGIIDPVKVTRNCIENAVSAGGTLLTLECAIATVEDKKML